MKKRIIEYKISELESLNSRITKLSDDIYKLVDKYDEKGQHEASHRLKLDLYFLFGMRQMIDVLIAAPSEIYTRLHQETIAVEETINNFINREKLNADRS